LLAALSAAMPRTRWQAFMVQPATLLAWHRRLGRNALDLPAPQSRTSTGIARIIERFTGLLRIDR
jgi:hypothetical protein